MLGIWITIIIIIIGMTWSKSGCSVTGQKAAVVVTIDQLYPYLSYLLRSHLGNHMSASGPVENPEERYRIITIGTELHTKLYLHVRAMLKQPSGDFTRSGRLAVVASV